jgi:AcrR family transcriptional regulator
MFMSGHEHDATDKGPQAKAEKPKNPRDAIVDALLRLAAKRDFGDITISDVAREAGVSLADFRDAFPSKGAVLGGFARRIDRQVLENVSHDHDAEPARERLYQVLSKRIDALEPSREAVFAIADWAAADPLSASALNRETVNSMRFMLEAADIDSEGPVGAIKLQGLAFAWKRVIDAWREDRPGEKSHAEAALDREILRGEKWIDRVEDIARTTEPLRNLAHRFLEGFTGHSSRKHESHHGDHEHEHPHAEA